jgi:hypothetical protein
MNNIGSLDKNEKLRYSKCEDQIITHYLRNSLMERIDSHGHSNDEKKIVEKIYRQSKLHSENDGTNKISFHLKQLHNFKRKCIVGIYFETDNLDAIECIKTHIGGMRISSIYGPLMNINKIEEGNRYKLPIFNEEGGELFLRSLDLHDCIINIECTHSVDVELYLETIKCDSHPIPNKMMEKYIIDEIKLGNYLLSNSDKFVIDIDYDLFFIGSFLLRFDRDVDSFDMKITSRKFDKKLTVDRIDGRNFCCHLNSEMKYDIYSIKNFTDEDMDFFPIINEHSKIIIEFSNNISHELRGEISVTNINIIRYLGGMAGIALNYMR